MRKKTRVPLVLKKTLYFAGGAVSLLLAAVAASALWLAGRDFRSGILEDIGFVLFGLFGYLFLHPFMRRNPRTYVIAHELTHAIAVWLCHGWTHSLRIRKNTGYVLSNKDNFFISLSPYFFPFYTVFALILYGAAAAVTKNSLIFIFLKTILGMTIGFHILFTLEMAVTAQDDFRRYGAFFSRAVIVMMNLLLFAGLLILLSKDVNIELFFSYAKNCIILFATEIYKMVK
jgi:hypothetical protein